MQTKITKWGNSLGVRLPVHVVEGAALSEGAPVEISVEDGAVVVRSTRKKYKLSDLLKGYEKPQNSAAIEVDWGTAQGDEEW